MVIDRQSPPCRYAADGCPTGPRPVSSEVLEPQKTNVFMPWATSIATPHKTNLAPPGLRLRSSSAGQGTHKRDCAIAGNCKCQRTSRVPLIFLPRPRLEARTPGETHIVCKKYSASTV